MDLGPCPICLVPCPIADLVEHIVHAHAATKKQKCEKCTKEFELKSDLENHIKEKHSQPEIVEIEEGANHDKNKILTWKMLCSVSGLVFVKKMVQFLIKS